MTEFRIAYKIVPPEYSKNQCVWNEKYRISCRVCDSVSSFPLEDWQIPADHRMLEVLIPVKEESKQ